MNFELTIKIIGPAYPLRGGLSAFNERLARQFLYQGNSTMIYTFSLQYPSFLFPGKTQLTEELPPVDVYVDACINSINPFNWIKVGKEIKKAKPDIVIVRYWLPFMGPCLGSILRIIRQNKHTKIICIADNIIPHEKRFGDKAFTKYFIGAVDGFITMSQKVLNDLKLFTTKPASYVPHPLYDNFGDSISKSVAKEHLKIEAGTKVILFFGLIRKYKGLDLLLEAIHILQENGFLNKQQIKFLIAGEFYDDALTYLDLITKYKLENHIILHDKFIPDKEIRHYFCAADCVIQPYKNATQSGVTPLAYHYEVPLIVTDVGGLPSLVPETVGMVTQPDAKSISETIIAFFSKDLSIYIQNLKEEKKKYEWENLTKEIYAMYHKLAKDVH